MARKWGNNYNGTQMLQLCQLSPFDIGPHNRCERLVTKILANVVTEKDPVKLTEALSILLSESCSVSIGKSLEKLISVGTTGTELDFDRDGLDALSYHLDRHTAKKAIDVLQALLKRFDE